MICQFLTNFDCKEPDYIWYWGLNDLDKFFECEPPETEGVKDEANR